MLHKITLFILIVSFSCLFFISVVNTAPAEDEHSTIMNSSDLFFFNELNAMVNADKGDLLIQISGPAEQRPDKYRSVDIRQNDVIMAIDGKRIKSIAELKEIYDALNVGEDIRMGIRRDNIMKIVNFPKADPKQFANRKFVIHRTVSDDESDNDESMLPEKRMVLQPDGKGGKILVLAEAGLIIRENDSCIVLETILSNASDVLIGDELEDGDVIKVIQGESVNSSDQFSKVYEGIDVGENVTLSLSRDNKKLSVSFKKSEPNQNVIIRHE
jgi:PDZ domain-containing secreted protein